MAKYVYGIKSVKFGTPTGSNTMPDAGSMTQWAQTVEGSLTVSEDEAQTKDFKVEETTTPVKSVVTDAGALKVKWRAYDMTPENLVKVKGGEAPDANTYNGPASVIAQELALEIETEEGIKFSIYKSSVLGRIDGSIGRASLLEVEASATALDPGNGESPYKIAFPAS